MAAHKTQSRKASPILSSTLSLREEQVLEFLTLGLSNKEIGSKLDLSPFTVKNHLARIFTKLGARGRTAAVMTYLRGR